MSKGTQFEILAQKFFERIFDEINYVVLKSRRQKSGTQNGFDISIQFLDDNDNEQNLFIECKDYTSELDWKNLLTKLHELDASAYDDITGFIGLSPKVNISNIGDNVENTFSKRFDFPVRLLTPDNNVKQLFALDETIYTKIYGNTPDFKINRDKELKKFNYYVKSIIEQKTLLKIADKISIPETDKMPTEEEVYKTTLDEKLDAIYKIEDPLRVEYHQIRCNYKVYLEELVDINNQLRAKILDWQNDLRLLANRLTDKFRLNADYSPKQFFHDFFDSAEIRLLKFLQTENIDTIEKLLHGIVFELAAECPLDWRQNHE